MKRASEHSPLPADHEGPLVGFVALAAFVGLLSSRIEHGRSHGAYLALRALKAPPEPAHEIVDGWPLEDRRRAVAGISLEREQLLWLVFHLPNWRSIDWTSSLGVAMRAARAAE